MKNLHKFLAEAKQDHVFDMRIKNALSIGAVSQQENKLLDIQLKSLQKFLTTPFIIEEKFNGTKLNVIRNLEPYDKKASSFENNWIVTYKGNILFPFEFKNIDTIKIKNESYGISQYKLIHAILNETYRDLENIVPGTEFFIEFLMNKPTITTKFSNTNHNFILLGNSNIISLDIKNGKVTTILNEFIHDPNEFNNKHFSLETGIQIPQCIFKGPLFLSNGFNVNGCITKDLKQKVSDSKFLTKLNDAYNELSQNGPWMTATVGKKEQKIPVVMALLHELFTTYATTLNTKNKIEGSVLIKGSINSDIRYKFVNEDQYIEEVRNKTKEEYLGNKTEQTKFFAKIKERAIEIFDSLLIDHSTSSSERLLEKASQLIFDMDLSDIHHSKKTNFNKQEDLYTAIRPMILNHVVSSVGDKPILWDLYKDNNFGFVVGKFRLPTNAHFDLFKYAASNTNGLIIAIVTNDKQFGLTFEQRKQVINDALLKINRTKKFRIIEVSSASLTKILTPYKNIVSTLFCGEDRKLDYTQQLKTYNKRYHTAIELEVLPRKIMNEDDDLSSTNIETLIKNKDIKKAQQLTSKFDYIDVDLISTLI